MLLVILHLCLGGVDAFFLVFFLVVIFVLVFHDQVFFVIFEQHIHVAMGSRISLVLVMEWGLKC